MSLQFADMRPMMGAARSSLCFAGAVLKVIAMKRTLSMFVLSIVLLASAFIARAGDFELKGKAGEYNIDVRIDRNPPGRGHNGINVMVTDRASRPVTDAEVEIEYLMPSLRGRPPMMDYKTKAQPAGGKYHADLNLSMAGEWRVIVKVARGGKGETVGFTFVVE